MSYGVSTNIVDTYTILCPAEIPSVAIAFVIGVASQVRSPTSLTKPIAARGLKTLTSEVLKFICVEKVVTSQHTYQQFLTA